MNIVSKVRLTIGTKLVGLIAVLLMASVVSLVLLATRLFVEDNTALIQKMNADTAASLATQVRELLQGTSEKMRMLGTILMQNMDEQTKGRLSEEFFSKDKDFLAFYINKHEQAGSNEVLRRAISQELKNLNDTDGQKLFDSIQANRDFSLAQVSKGDVQLASIKLADERTAIVLAIPFIEGQSGFFTHTMTMVLRQERFVKAFGESDVIISFMVDHKGKLLAHPDTARVAAQESVSHLGIVKQLLEGKFNNGQTRYVDTTNNEAKIGAYRMVGFGGLGIISEVPESKALEAAQRVTLRAIYLAGIILFMSFLAGYFFSGTITWPLKQLMQAAKKITEGDFDINLKPKGQDEIAALSLTFNEMAKGLEERDRVKDTFNKFHNKEVAEKLLSGEVALGGERRIVTIFFSDVRGFTGMSESMQPEEVVTMLNEYMTRMVTIIRNNGGIVDKYVGDAIMALWGVPEGTPDDTFNAVNACLEMRMELNELNKLRLSRGQPVLKIGMGLNTGPVIAGNIGSEDKMEYTVIGDSVNLASRIESLTKEYGTDMLISKNVYDIIKDEFIFEECESAKVKGKSSSIRIFKVRGYNDENGKPVILETPYSSYASEKSDKVVHDKPDAKPEAKSEVATSPNVHAVMHETTAVIPKVKGQWYINASGQIYGPFTEQEVKEGIANQELSLDMLASTSLNEQWNPLSSFPDFSALKKSA